MTDFKAGCSPITSEIFVGEITKDGRMWKGKKHNITDTVFGAVAQNLLQTDEKFKFGYEGNDYVMQVIKVISDKDIDKMDSLDNDPSYGEVNGY